MKKETKILLIFSLASFFNDIGSDMIFPIWPLFVRDVIKASRSILGLIDGVGELMASLGRIFGSFLSDKIRKRKKFIALGYFLAFFSRIGYSFSTLWNHLLFFKAIDRIGKIRQGPRDAIISDVSKKSRRGRNFGIQRAFDNLGAVLGVLLTLALFPLLGFRNIFLIAAFPSLLSTVLILFFIKEENQIRKKVKFKIKMNKNYLLFLFSITIFSLGYFSYSFLLLFAKNIVGEESVVPFFYLVFVFSTSLFATFFGKISDKIGRKKTLAMSYFLWISSLVLLFYSRSFWSLMLSFFIYGLQKACFIPSSRAFISELSEKSWRASAFGIFDAVSGVCLLLSSIICGVLWDYFGFYASLHFSLSAVLFSFIPLFLIKE